jgi:hypothetical protein
VTKTGGIALSEDDELSSITADLVVLSKNLPFLKRLFTLEAGKWLDISVSCNDLPEVQQQLQKTWNDSEPDEALFATWILSPDADESDDEDDFCVIFFWTIIGHWSTNIVYNRSYFLENHK